MKNLWPEAFGEDTRSSVKLLLEEQASLLPKITNGIVSAEVVGTDWLSETVENNDFMYRFNIVGKFTREYRFRVLSFSHDITLYPTAFQLDEKLGDELGIRTPHRVTLNTLGECEELVGRILKSHRVASVVRGLVRLSR